MDETTLNTLLTLAGGTIAAAIITSVVSIIKTTFAKAPGVLVKISDIDGMFMAGVFSALLYGWVYVGTHVDPFTVFVAWIGASLLALGIHKGVVNPVVDAIQSKTP